MMYELFFQKFNEKVTLTKEEEEIIKIHLTPKKLRKKQYLLQEGDVNKFVAFVEKGVLRSYTIDDKGGEHIIQFALEGWLISDLQSFTTGNPATQTIDAIEDCELIMISRAANETLIETLPKYERWLRLQITGGYIALQRRLNSIISLSLDERYTCLSELYPDVIQRVPQHMIASYMGLTPETLSRMRKKRTSAK
jgi:CRP-like cAMP-binding protein